MFNGARQLRAAARSTATPQGAKGRRARTFERTARASRRASQPGRGACRSHRLATAGCVAFSPSFLLLTLLQHAMRRTERYSRQQQIASYSVASECIPAFGGSEAYAELTTSFRVADTLVLLL